MALNILNSFSIHAHYTDYLLLTVIDLSYSLVIQIRKWLSLAVLAVYWLICSSNR